MDLVTGLPVSGGFDAICVLVGRLNKRARYLPTRKAADAAEIAKIFFDQIIVIHGLPRSIVFDHDPRSLHQLSQELMSTLYVPLHMTVAHRAQADGQSELQIRTLEDVLRCTVSNYGDDWLQRLPSIEFAHASLVSSSISKAPIEFDTGRQLPTRLWFIPSQNQFLADRQAAIVHAKEQLAKAEERQTKFYDRHRVDTRFTTSALLNKNLSSPDYDISQDPTKNKLLPRWIGPFPIAKGIGTNAYKLVLPTVLRSHKVFNVDQLKLFFGCPPEFVGHPIRRVAPVIYDNHGHQVYVVVALLKKQRSRERTQYLVKWADLPESQNSWENVGSISHVLHWGSLLANFRERQQQTLPPPRTTSI
ncbi:Retroelement [Phytophthora megakarya]|uniref:Retroelement n=1 Tax=Phytophthora megakarya TaxID=4795 RepID=A0A225VMJ5_9STRA|nr:Retroelement [Phytophthora megakarya]